MEQARLHRIASGLRQNGFAVRVADPGDTVAVRLGAGPGLVGLVVSADVGDMRDKGVVMVPHVSTADVRPYSLSRRNLWRQAERALIRSVGVG